MVRWNRFLLSALSALLALGCTSYRADVKTICEAGRLSMVDTTSRGDDPTMRFRYVADWIDRNVDTAEGHALIAEVRPDTVSMADKARTLRAAATAVGLDGCAFADSLATR